MYRPFLDRKHREYIVYILWISGMIAGILWAYFSRDLYVDLIRGYSLMRPSVFGSLVSCWIPMCLLLILGFIGCYPVLFPLLWIRAVIYGFSFCAVTLYSGVYFRSFLLYAQTVSNLIILYFSASGFRRFRSWGYRHIFLFTGVWIAVDYLICLIF